MIDTGIQKLKFSIIGMGRISGKHIEAIKSDPRAELVSVCDIIPEKAKAVGEKLQIPYYTDYHEMLEKEDIDCVNVCTPHPLHCKHVLDIAPYGKHIICEKPLALTVEDCDKMIDVCRKNKIKLFEIKQNRYNAPVVELLKAVESGLFGKMVTGGIRVRWMRTQSYYDSDIWRKTDGCLINQGAHAVDLLLKIFGDVEEVRAFMAKRLIDFYAEDTCVAIVRFKSGAITTIEVTTATRPKDLECSISVLGSNGVVEISGYALNCLKTWAFNDNIPKNEDTPIESPLMKSTVEEFNGNPPNVYGKGHFKCISNIIDSLISGRNGSAVDGEEAKKTIALIQRIYESAA